jgi:hypothetical protein
MPAGRQLYARAGGLNEGEIVDSAAGADDGLADHIEAERLWRLNSDQPRPINVSQTATSVLESIGDRKGGGSGISPVEGGQELADNSC